MDSHSNDTETNEIVGVKQRPGGTWYIAEPHDTPYESFHELFGASPKELSADLCAYYFLRHVEPKSPFETFTKPPYITTKIEAWIEKYIVLPEPQAQADG